MAVAVATWWISWVSWANSVPFLGRLLSVFALGARCSKKKTSARCWKQPARWSKDMGGIEICYNTCWRYEHPFDGRWWRDIWLRNVDMVIATLRCHLNRETFDKSVVVFFFACVTMIVILTDWQTHISKIYSKLECFDLSNGLEGAKELWLMVDLTFDSIVDSQRIQLDDEDVL